MCGQSAKTRLSSISHSILVMKKIPAETIEEGECLKKREELADLIKPTIQNAEGEEMDLISNCLLST